MQGGKVKMCDSSLTRAIPERFRDQHRIQHLSALHVLLTGTGYLRYVKLVRRER